MIEIYTKKQDSPDWILLNDMYFNVYTGNEEISEYEAKLIKQVDKANPVVAEVKKWVDKQYEEGRVTVITDKELIEQIAIACKLLDMTIG